jgi:hypothetical protein
MERVTKVPNVDPPSSVLLPFHSIYKSLQRMQSLTSVERNTVTAFFEILMTVNYEKLRFADVSEERTLLKKRQ